MFLCFQKHTWTFGSLWGPQPMRTDQKLEVSFFQQFIFLLLFSRKSRSEMYDNALCDSQAYNFLRGIHPPRPRQYLFYIKKVFLVCVRVCMAVVEIDRCTGVSASTAHYICLLFGQMRLRSFAEGKLLFCFCSFKQPKLKQGWI